MSNEDVPIRDVRDYDVGDNVSVNTDDSVNDGNDVKAEGHEAWAMEPEGHDQWAGDVWRGKRA